MPLHGRTAIISGRIQTDITMDNLTEGMKTETTRGVALSRLDGTREVANVYLLLASDLFAYVTGAVININEGILIR